MSSQLSKNNSNTKKFNVVRPKSIRQASKVDPIEFPANHAFLVYFECDGKFSLVEPNHSSWPVHLRSSDKLSLHYTDVEFKSAEKPGTSDTGKVITNGPEKVIERVGDYMNLQIDFGIQPEDMNLTAVFQRVYKELEDEKENTLPSTQNSKKVQENAAKSILVNDNEQEADELEPNDESDKSDNDDNPDEPVFPNANTQDAGVAKDVPALTTTKLVNNFFRNSSTDVYRFSKSYI